VWEGHLESRKNLDRLKRSIHVDRIGVHSIFVYIYAGLRSLMIWANCLFSFNTSFLFRKVDDVTTISKSQSLTSVSIKDCTLRVPNETTTLFLLRVIIKAIFIMFTCIHTEFTRVCVYIYIYTHGKYRCVGVYLHICTPSLQMCVRRVYMYVCIYLHTSAPNSHVGVHIFTYMHTCV